MITIIPIKKNQHFQNLKSEWNQLLFSNGINNIFLTWDWLYSWWKIWGNEKELFILTAREKDGTLRGIAPLYMAREYFSGFLKKKIRFIGDGISCSEYLDFIVDRESKSNLRADFLYFLMHKNIYDWDIIEFGPILAGSEIAYTLTKFGIEEGLLVRLAENISTYYVSLPKTWDDYLGNISRNTRHNLRRFIKKLDSGHSWRFYQWDSGDHLDEAMETLFDLHSKRWASMGRSGVFKRKSFCEFHKEVARNLFENGKLRLYFLEIDGEARGAIYGFAQSDKISLYQSGWDPKWEGHGIGTLLIGMTIRESIAQGFKELDFLRGKSPYKMHWRTSQRDCIKVLIGKKSLSNSLAFKCYDLLEKSKCLGRQLLPNQVLNTYRFLKSERILRKG